MAIKRTSVTDKIYHLAVSTLGITPEGAFALLGNIYAESGALPEMVEGLLIQRYSEDGQKRWGRPVNTAQNIAANNALYVKLVDSRSISMEEFLNPRRKQYGFGVCQWTSRGRKMRLWNNTREKGKSIADIDGQAQTLKEELEGPYQKTLAYLRICRNIEDASDYILIHFEAPANAESMKKTRRSYSKEYQKLYATQPAKPAEGGTMHRISNSGHDERGKYKGGKPGDQTGEEWQIRSWYSRPWSAVIRFPEPYASMLADLAEKAAKNNLIGYCQDHRGTYWQHLKASGYDPSKITVACEADCSAGVAANVKAVGYLTGNKAMQGVSSDAYTGNIVSACKAAGATILRDSKYLNSPDYLLPGDLPILEGHHICTNLDRGSKAQAPKNNPVKTDTKWTPIGTATVAASAAYVRSAPEITSTNHLTMLKLGNRFEVNGERNGQWIKVKTGSTIGWMHGSLVKYDGQQETSGKAKKTTTEVYVRRTAGVGDNLVKTFGPTVPAGTEVEIEKMVKAPDGSEWALCTIKNLKKSGYIAAWLLK